MDHPPLSDVTNMPSPAKQKPPPPPDAPTVTEAADLISAPEPSPNSEAEKEPTPQAISAQLKCMTEKMMQHEHRVSISIFVCGHVLFATIYFGSFSFANVAAWIGLLYLLGGGVASMVGKRESLAVSQQEITEADLKPFVDWLLDTSNAALRLHYNLFRCGAPKQALKGALALYSLTFLSGHLSTLALLWLGFNGAFVAPVCYSLFEQQMTAKKLVLLEKLHTLNALAEEHCPKKFR